jgi:hypothetical protein
MSENIQAQWQRLKIASSRTAATPRSLERSEDLYKYMKIIIKKQLAWVL